MRLFYFILLIFSSLYSEPLIDTAKPDISTAPKDCPSTAPIYDSTLEETRTTNLQFIDGTPPLGTWFLDSEAETSQRYKYYYYFEYYYSNYAHITYVTATNYCSVCNEPDTSTPPPSPPLYKIWEIVYTESCNGSFGDKSLYDEADETQRAIGTDTVDCCTSTTYYVAKFPQDCPDGEQELNGECYPNPITCTSPMVSYDEATSYEQCQAKIDIENEVGEWKTQDGFYKCCYEPYTPPTDYCTVKGDGWVTTSDTTSTDCESHLDGVTVDSVDFTTRDDGSTTCCIHNMDTNTTEPDTNTTEPDTNTTEPDTNTTEPDTNTTLPLDIDEKLDDIKESIDSSSSTNHSDLEGIKESIDSSSSTNHSDLEGIKESIDSSSSTNHSDLEGIKESIDNLKEDLTDSSSNGIDDLVNKYNSIISDATTTIPQKFNKLFSYSFGSVPVFADGGGSCVFEGDTTIAGHITLDLNPYIAMIYPYSSLMFSLLFVFISVSWWYKAFKIIVMVVL